MVESMTIPEPLLISRRFGPLFATQFLGAFNGNLVKTAMLFLLVFGGPADGSDSGGAMVSIAAAVFVTPMVIFSAYAGSLADAHDKATMAQMSKRAEVGAVIIAAVAIALHSTAAMLASLFLLGTVSNTRSSHSTWARTRLSPQPGWSKLAPLSQS
jgi:MFS family permease